MALFDRLTKTAQENKQRIVLAEGTEPRTLTAADMIIRDGIADIILLGKPEEVKAKAAELSLSNIVSTRPIPHSQKNMRNCSTSYANRKA